MLAALGTSVALGLAGCNDAGGGADTTEDEDGMDTPTDEMGDGTTTEGMGDMTETPSGTANVRVAHLSPNAPNVDVYVDDEQVLSDVPFRAVSDYLELPAGDHTVQITAAGDPDTVAFEGDITVEAADYTIAAIGELGEGSTEFRPAILEDDNSEVGSDTARVRVVHASPDAPAVDVAAGGDVLVEGAEFGDAAYVEVPAGEYDLQIRPSGEEEAVAEFPAEFAGGTVYTAYAVGYLEPEMAPGDSAPAFDLELSVDAGGDGGMTETGNVRVAHVSPDAPNVDVYVDDDQVLSDVPFGEVSDYLEVPTGDRTVQITAAGDPDTVAFEGDVPVEAADYTIAAVGELTSEDTEFRPLVLEDDNSDPGGDSARLRVVHASPDAPAVDVTAEGAEDALFDGVPFGGSGYVTVPATDYTVQIRPDSEGNDGDVVADFDVSLNGGTVYTAFAQGYLSPDDESADPAFDLNVVQDASY